MIQHLQAILADRRRFIPPILVMIAIAAYAQTMNPTVSFIDSGELAAVTSMLGIAHPTGYPFFSILGRLVVMIIPTEQILALNGFAVALVSASLVTFYLLALEILEFSGERSTNGNSLLAALSGSLVFGFSTTVWAQSVSVEVYSLQLVLILLFLLFFFKGIRPGPLQEGLSPYHLLAAYTLGLAFTNHMTTLLVIPACLYLSTARFGLGRSSLRRLAQIVPFVLLGLSVYAYLPIRSAQQPLLDWGHPAEPERLLWHITGKQYRSWIFSGFETAEKQLMYFISNFPSVFSWIAIVLLFVGLWGILAKSRQAAWFIVLLIAGCIGYSINYDIHDIDSYFLVAYVGVGLLIVVGMHELLVRLRNIPRVLAVGMIVALPVFEFVSHRSQVDESDNLLVQDYTLSALSSLDSNAVVFTYQWDYLVSASYYFQHIKKIRSDVAVIDKELLRRSWYFIQLERTHPWLFEKTRLSIDLFLSELYKFEHGQPYNGAVIEARFNAMVNAMIDSAMQTVPVYVGAEIEQQYAGAYDRVPDGLLLRLRPRGTTTDLQDFNPPLKYTQFQSRLTRGLRTQYAKVLTLRAIWLLKAGESTETAKTSLQQALEFDSSYIPAIRLLAAVPQ